MSLTSTQQYFTKLYLAAFNRAPELSGLNYWSDEVLVQGKSLQTVGGIIFSLPVVTAIYPSELTDLAFVEAIYQNVFGRGSDAEGLAYWMNEIAALRDTFSAEGSLNAAYEARGQLVMNMINAGLGTVDGTDGKAYITNRLEVAEYAVEQQLTAESDIPVTALLDIFAGVDADEPTVPQGKCEVNSFFDATAPTLAAAIDSVTDDIGAVTGVVANNGTTDDIAPLLAGTLEAPLALCETLAVYRDGVLIGNAAVDGTGWTYADSGLTNGLHSYTVRVVDLAGNLGAASAVYRINVDSAQAPVDTTAPVLQTAVVDGATLTLTYDEALNAASDAAASSFTVNVNGAPLAISSVDANGTTVTLTLASAVLCGQQVNVSYTPPATSPTEDVAGNDAAAFSAQAVDNLSPAANTPVTYTPNSGTAEGSSDASTGIAIDSNWMIVGDDEANVLRVYDRDDGGAAIVEWNYEANLSITKELDLEASAQIGTTLYFIGSHSNKSGGAEADNREHIFAVDISGTGAATSFSFISQYAGIETALVTWDASDAHGLGAGYFGFAASSADSVAPEQVGGFSIEGLAASLDNSQLLLSFRAPQSDISSRDTAIIVPLDVSSLLTTPSFGTPIELDLGGRGIRSMEKAADGSGYLIIAGPAGAASLDVTHDFRLFTWDGVSTSVTELDNNLDALLSSTGGSFESIVGLSSIDSGSCVQLLQDNGDTVWAGQTDASKDLAPADQQFQGNMLQLGNAVSDTNGPTLMSAAPADEAADVAVGADIVLKFDEGVKAGAGSFTIRQVSDNSVVATIAANDASQVSYAFNTVTINPSTDLANATAYYVEADATAVTDHSGNAWAGISGATTLNFTTAAAPVGYELLITEVNSNANGGDFFELYNYGTSAIDLTGWKWDDEAASFNTTAVAFTTETIIAAGERIIVATGTTDASVLRAAWGIPGSVQVVAVGGSNLGKQDAVVVFDDAGNVATAFNYDTTSVTASDGTVITTALASAGSSFSDNQHAGTAYNGGVLVDKSSAVWDGISTINPTYKAAAVGDLGAYVQCDGVSVGSLGGSIARGYNPSTPYTESFGVNLGTFTAYSVDTDTAHTWYRASSSTAEVNAFGDTAPANDWLISQSFDLTQTSVEYLSFTTWTRYSDTGVVNPEVKLMYSTNYSGTGDPTAATWTELSYTPSADNSQVTTPSGLIDLSGISGCNVYFAFQYTSSGTASNSSSSWRADDFNITGYSGAVLSLAATDAAKVEGDSGTTAFTFTVTRAGDTSGTSTADYAVSGAAVDATDFSGTLPAGSVSFAVGETSKLITVNVSGDTSAETNEAFTLTLSNASIGSVIAQASATGTIQDDDAAATLVSAVQGNGAASTMDGSIVTVEAIVTAIMPGLSGFYIQEETADSDGNASTSEGIFVYGSAASFTVGDLVRLTAEVDEFSGLTELKNISGSSIVSSGNALPTASVITLPVADMINWEAVEGMLVNVQSGTGNLVITDNYNLGRYGQVTLTSDTLLQQFTETDAPDVAGYTAYQATVQKDQIIIDDNQTAQNPAVLPGRDGNDLSASNTLRAGDSISSVVGVVDQYVSGGELGYETTYRIQPTIEPVFTGAARPTSADLPAAITSAEIKVASVNVLNYFTTLDDGSTFTNPNGTTHDPRGANDAAEFARQQDKLVANLLGLDADVYAMMEMQNNGFGDETSAIDALVDALNAASAPGTYAYVAAPYNDGAATVGDAPTAGDDAIMVAFIYKTSAVSVVGQAAVADPSVYDAFSATYGNRVPVAVTFQSLSDGETFTAVANHFKSKGSVIDADTGDGQGANNLARMEAATDLLTWLATNPTGTADNDILLLGDFNAYSHEDPITYIDNNGYNKVSSGLSYSFDGLWGSLDHALTSDSLTSQVTGAVKWAINAEEPGILDYNMEYKDAAQDISYYAADAYRSSDHNPILIGLNLGSAPDAVAPTFVSASVNGASLTMTYDETLNAANPPLAGDFAVNVGGSARSVNAVAVSGATVTLTLASAVAAGETVTVAYTDPTAGNDANAIQDIAGNDAATLSAQSATNVTDGTAPTLTGSTPADEAVNVSRTANIVLNFSENVQKGTGDIVIKKSSDDSVFATIAVGDAQVSVSGAQVTINPSANLDFSTSYYVEMAAGVFEDLAGNDYLGLAGNDALDFTSQGQTAVFISELHYDNSGTDANEGVGVMGAAGTDLSGWSVVFYNGSGGASYGTINLSGLIDDEGSGYGELSFNFSGIQNGAPDGLALVNNLGNVVQFLSYEGSFTAVGGAAGGMTSTDIGVSQAGTTTGNSIQLVGVGHSYEDFTWAGDINAMSMGSINAGITIA